MSSAWAYSLLLGVIPAIVLIVEVVALCKRAIVWFRKRGI